MAVSIGLFAAIALGATPRASLGDTATGSVASPALRPPAVLDAAAVPYLPEAGRADYRRFVQQATPRAFAVSPDGSWGWAASLESQAATDARAVEICAHWGGQGCRIYARDLEVVWPGRESTAPLAAEVPLRIGIGWTLVPDGRFLWQGPEAARGAYVWAHGRAAGGQDSRGSQPQPHVRVFNNAGYDVLRFDRDPLTDETDDAAAWLQGALKSLRARGYRRVVVGGQSRGAWNALQALAEPGLVDGVVAVAPAAHGATGSPAWAWALSDLRQVVEAARSPAARVAIAAFRGDEFDPDPEGRARIFRSLAAPAATPRVGGLLFLDRPAEVQGHGGGADARFTLRYGHCLLDFVERRVERCG
ncbi:alpha/beta fold hydrolase [Siccirubricoccus sp. G192]|uniref:alpha/beta fold hydrolase n=1 Tax=Siccirubricoccus sp. G192 TaxID=2849651 RepID=UPI001C2CBCC4|nr:alpha/beta hydrolase [Siccirubricoccus sp. G192]MBV1797477.1 alpha/beta hydrolase [Siccirubricoccus sp. G192]